MKDKIKQILMDNFKSVYCDTCDGEYCEDCYRKNMNWGISEWFAESIAEKIINEGE